jgi:hypothetical protein
MSICDYILGQEDWEDVIRWKKVAGCFRKGDAVAISSLFMDIFCTDHEEGRDCSMCSPEARDACDLMSRIQEAAEILEADETPRSWQITEERKAAIDRSMRFLSWANAKTNDPGTEIDLAVLRAMLTEAGQE